MSTGGGSRKDRPILPLVKGGQGHKTVAVFKTNNLLRDLVLLCAGAALVLGAWVISGAL